MLQVSRPRSRKEGVRRTESRVGSARQPWLARPVSPGWEPVGLSGPQLLAFGTAERMRTLANQVGQQIPRRQFLGRASRVALAAGLGLSYWLWDTERASAIPETCCGPHAFGCGPSELCPDADHCNSTGGCQLSNSAVKKRADPDGNWPGSHCPTPVNSNSWPECCQDGRKLCTDCCVGGCGSCDSCSGQCSGKKKCICRIKLCDAGCCNHDPDCPPW